MKCLKLVGDESSIGGFIREFSEYLQDVSIGILRISDEKGITLTLPGGIGTVDILKLPDMLLVIGDKSLAAPVIWCGENPPDMPDPLILFEYGRGFDSSDFKTIFRRTFHLLPQKSNEECGKCGSDCLELARAMVSSTRNPEDCFYHSRWAQVLVNGRIISMGEFPSRMIEGSLRGLLSSLKGYVEDSEVNVRLIPAVGREYDPAGSHRTRGGENGQE